MTEVRTDRIGLFFPIMFCRHFKNWHHLGNFEFIYEYTLKKGLDKNLLSLRVNSSSKCFLTKCMKSMI